MKTKHFVITGMIGIALAGMVITGCKKESTADTDATAAQDDANASFALNDSKTISDGAAKGQATERILLGACATITADSSATNDTIDIHFPGGCVSPDGRVRKGDIIVYWKRGVGYFDSAASITETWRNYSVTTTGGTIIGIGNGSTRTLTNLGYDNNGDCSWSFNANLTLNYSGATTGKATWTSSRTNTLTNVGGVYYYVITGGASGTSRTGVSYTLTITQPLYWTAYWINIFLGKTAYICDCFESGTVEYSRTGKTYPLYLQFTSGVGKCAHTATATINGNNYNITLP
jgi:hypothetical protein